jgi:hypothetical protein
MLAASSSFKGKSDLDKYGTAIRLKSHIGEVRRFYTQKIHSKVFFFLLFLILFILFFIYFLNGCFFFFFFFFLFDC